MHEEVCYIFADTDVPGEGRIPLFLAGFMA